MRENPTQISSIAGDFDVPSSREDLDSDSPWNQWLLSHLPSLFLESLSLFADAAEGDSIKALKLFLPFLPSALRIAEEPFASIAKKIFAGLKLIAWIPVASHDDEHDNSASEAESPSVKTRLACETAVAANPLVRRVLTPRIISATFGLNYVDERVEHLLRTRRRNDVDFLADLGIQTLRLEHLLEVGPQISNRGDAKEIGLWLSAVAKMAFVDDEDTLLDEATLQTLKELKIIPLSNSSLVSLNDGVTVYFPRDSQHRPDGNADEQRGESDSFIEELERDLSTVSGSLFAADDAEGAGRGWLVKKLLLELGVIYPRPEDVVDNHILPILRDEERRKNKSDKTLVSYVVYLKDQWARKRFSLQKNGDLKAILPMATNKGIKTARQCPIHFGAEYGNSLVDLQSEFPSVKWVILDSTYLYDFFSVGAPSLLSSSGAASSFEISLWRDFFSLFGVTDFIRVDSLRCVKSVADVRSSIEAKYFENEFRDYIDDDMEVEEKIEIEDFESFEMKTILETTVDAGDAHAPQQISVQDARTRMQRLFELLELCWKPIYRQFGEKRMTFRGKTITFPSSFARRLLEAEWIPCLYYYSTDALSCGSSNFSRECFLAPGSSNIFVRNTRVINLCGDHVPYILPGTSKDVEISNSDFCAFLGLIHTVSVDAMIDLLKSWSSRSNLGDARSFLTTTGHMVRVYNFLREEMPAKQFRELISSGPVVFVPSMVGVKMKDPVEGVFVGGAEVCWSDCSKTFKKYRPVLSSSKSSDANALHAPTVKFPIQDLYPAVHAKELFLQAGVSEFPSVDEYLQMLVFVSSLSAPAVGLCGRDKRTWT